MGQQFNFSKILEFKKIFGPRKFLIQIIGYKSNFDQNILGPIKFCPKQCGSKGPKIFWSIKIFDQKKMFGPKNVESEIFF